MKRYFILTTLVCMSFMGYSQEVQTSTGALVQFDKEYHNYGEIMPGSDGTCSFTVINIGNEPLLLENCKGSCGCTIPFCQKAPIMPGDSTKVDVKYDTNRIGPINKSITIMSNAVNEPVKVLRIMGSVLSPPVPPVNEN